MSYLAPHLLWLLLAVPITAAGAAWVWRRRLANAAAWSGSGLWKRLMPGYRRRRLVAITVLACIALTATVMALARPSWGYVEELVEREGVDIVFVIDSSLSMSAIDLNPDRLGVAKVVVRRLLAEIPGHRVGLVQSEGEGEVLAPLTLDRAVVDLLLSSIEPASLPVPGTQLGAGIDKAIELLPDDAETHGLIVVVSDGEDHGAGFEEILERAKASGAVIHAVAVGTTTGAPLPVPGTSPVRYKTDPEGRQVHSRLQPELLERLAATTGGTTLEVTSASVELEPLVAAIAAAEQRSLGAETVRQRQERFQWFLLIAAAALGAALVSSPFEVTS